MQHLAFHYMAKRKKCRGKEVLNIEKKGIVYFGYLINHDISERK